MKNQLSIGLSFYTTFEYMYVKIERVWVLFLTDILESSKLWIGSKMALPVNLHRFFCCIYVAILVFLLQVHIWRCCVWVTGNTSHLWKFEIAMTQIRELNPNAERWLQKISLEMWVVSWWRLSLWSSNNKHNWKFQWTFAFRSIFIGHNNGGVHKLSICELNC